MCRLPSGLRCAALDYADLVTRLLVASRNPKKLAELRRVLDAASLSGLTLVSLDDVPPFDEAPETGATFEDNALAKARDGFAATGCRPSPTTRGWKWLRSMACPVCCPRGGRARTATTPATRRCCWLSCATCPMSSSAAFVSACALVSGSDEVVVRGEWPGAIAREPRGDAGFGYDPVFIADGEDRTAAQLTSAEKDAASHRGRALALLLPALRALDH